MVRIICDHIMLLLTLVFLSNGIVKAGDLQVSKYSQIDWEEGIKDSKLLPADDNAVRKEENEKPEKEIEELDFSTSSSSNQVRKVFSPAIEIGEEDLISVIKFLEEQFPLNQEGGATSFYQDPNSVKENSFKNMIKHKIINNCLIIAISSCKQYTSELNYEEYIQYLKGAINEDQFKAIKDCFFTGYEMGALRVTKFAHHLKDKEKMFIRPNQIKLILFSYPQNSEDFEVKFYNQTIGKVNILHFKQRKWFGWFREKSLEEIGIPLYISLLEQPYCGFNLKNDFKEEMIRKSFRYGQENYITSPETDLDCIGVPSIFSFSNRRGLL